MAETDNPKNTRLLAMVVGTVAALIVVVLVIIQYFDMSVRTEVYEKVLSQQSTVLRDLRAQEQSKLTRYAWVDQKTGVVQLPLDRAAELTLRDWDQRPSGLVKVDETAPPPTTPAPAAPAAPAPGGAAAPAPAGAAPAAPAGGTTKPAPAAAPAVAPSPAAPGTAATKPAATPATTPGTAPNDRPAAAPPAQPPKP